MEKITREIEGLDVLNKAIEISSYCMTISFQVNDRQHDSNGEKLRRCALNVYKNIANSIEAITEKDFFTSLSSAKRCLLETGHILLVLNQSHMIQSKVAISLFNELILLNQKISQYEKALFN